MSVHVSLHDVSPAWADQVDVALEMAHAVSVKPALLVVPDFHGKAPLGDHPAFCDRLRKLEAEGHEVYLHGFYHRSRAWSERGADEGTSTRDRARFVFRQRVVSGGEAEFSDVPFAEAKKRLDDGERVLRDAGLTIRGFVAPAWSMPRAILELLAERAYGFTEDHTHVYAPATGRSRPSVVLNFASRTPSRLFSSVAFCRAARPFARVLPARIAIHPADMQFALLRGEVRSLLNWGKRRGFAKDGASLLS